MFGSGLESTGSKHEEEKEILQLSNDYRSNEESNKRENSQSHILISNQVSQCADEVTPVVQERTLPLPKNFETHYEEPQTK